MANSKFRDLLVQNWPELGSDRTDKVVEFRERVVEESTRQNLTKLLDPEDFYYGHVEDVRNLVRFPGLTFPAMDLGSGCGVPGLLTAIIQPAPWVLVESEGRKADFLRAAVSSLGLEARVSVVSGRAEHWLAAGHSVSSIVARAVGPVARINAWLRECSTWNNLILFKGPGWTKEWEEYSQSVHRRDLIAGEKLEYQVGPEAKSRVIIKINRVPRGTFLKSEK